jgi:hypothetical protein
MKVLPKLLLVSLILSMSGSCLAFETTEYNCMSDCDKAGYSYSYCKSRCTYDNSISSSFSSSSHTDYQCMSNCDSRYSYSYCKNVCAY